MTLALSKQQKKYLDKNGPINSRTLQAVFKKSVKDQEKIQKQAAKLRKKEQ